MQTQLARGSDQTGLHRSNGNIQYLAYGSQFHSLEMPQVKHHTLVRRKSSQSAQDARAEFAAQELFLRVVGGSVVHNLIQEIVLLAFDAHLYRVILSAISFESFADDPRAEYWSRFEIPM